MARDRGGPDLVALARVGGRRPPSRTAVALRRTAAVLGLVLVAWTLGGGWYYADQLLTVDEPLSWRETVAVAELPGVACTQPDLRLDLVGLQAATADGEALDAFVTYGIDGDTTSLRSTCADGPIEGATGLTTPLPDGEAVADDLDGATTALVDPNAFTSPSQAGLPSQDVTVTTPLGDAPAWLVPGEGDAADTWVVIVHGRGNTRAEGLRLARVVHDLGHTSLVISYRNDGDAPDAPDGKGRFGTTEWEDLDAAVTFARTQAPRHLVLAGSSQGGALVATWLARSGQADAIDGLVLDSPLLSLGATLRQQAGNLGLPRPVAAPMLLGARLWARVQHGFSVGAVEHVAAADGWPDVPVLLLHGDADTTVPVGPSDELAARLGEQVTYVRPRGVEHVRTANDDPERYARIVREHLETITG